VAGLLRFLRLEPRKEGTDAEAPAVDPEIERLRKERKERFASGMEIAEDAPDARPFSRCAVCEAENGRFTERCTNCGAPLDTPEQRAYNDALWERTRAHKQAAAEALPEVPSSGTRAHGEELARDVARSEYKRLEWMAGRRPSVGARILTALPRPFRTAAILGGLAEIAGTGLAAYNTHETGWRFVFFASVALVGAIFVPRRR
jgi:hypothetical protein